MKTTQQLTQLDHNQLTHVTGGFAIAVEVGERRGRVLDPTVGDPQEPIMESFDRIYIRIQP